MFIEAATILRGSAGATGRITTMPLLRSLVLICLAVDSHKQAAPLALGGKISALDSWLRKRKLPTISPPAPIMKSNMNTLPKPAGTIANQTDTTKLVSLLALATGAVVMPQTGQADIIYTDMNSSPVTV